MTFLQAMQVKPNHIFPSFDLTEPDSLTLSIGHDCLNFCNGNAKNSIKKFSNHTAEIVLTDLYNKISNQPKPDPETFNNLLDLIAFHDENY